MQTCLALKNTLGACGFKLGSLMFSGQGLLPIVITPQALLSMFFYLQVNVLMIL